MVRRPEQRERRADEFRVVLRRRPGPGVGGLHDADEGLVVSRDVRSFAAVAQGPEPGLRMTLAVDAVADTLRVERMQPLNGRARAERARLVSSGSRQVIFLAGSLHTHPATGQATSVVASTRTTRLASSALARRWSTGRVGTVPPASNRATAGWVMPAARASRV